MHIQRLHVHHVRLPLAVRWAFAKSAYEAVESVLIKVECEDAVAWVETCPLGLPTYAAESAGSVAWTLVNQFAPQIVGQPFPKLETLAAALARFRGNSFAKAGLELCWWAWAATSQRQPLHRLLGGHTRSIQGSAALGRLADVDSLLAAVQQIPAKIPRLKLKIQPGWDIEPVRAVRQAFPHLHLHVDANGSYARADTTIFKALDSLNLEMIEQPLDPDDLLGHAELQRQLATPICLDESIMTVEHARQALHMGACQVINVKVGRLGGLGPACAVHDLSRDEGVPCWVGSMLESGIGTSINLELATLENFTLANAIPESATYHPDDTVSPPIVYNDGFTLQPSSGPYLGREVREDRVDAVTVAKWSVG